MSNFLALNFPCRGVVTRKFLCTEISLHRRAGGGGRRNYLAPPPPLTSVSQPVTVETVSALRLIKMGISISRNFHITSNFVWGGVNTEMFWSGNFLFSYFFFPDLEIFMFLSPPHTHTHTKLEVGSNMEILPAPPPQVSKPYTDTQRPVSRVFLTTFWRHCQLDKSRKSAACHPKFQQYSSVYVPRVKQRSWVCFEKQTQIQGPCSPKV